MEKMPVCAGYGRSSITPAFSVPLAGYGATQKRMSQRVLSEIFATCIAFSWGDEKLLLYTQDLINSNSNWVKAVRQRVTEKTGVPEDRILICSIHSHSVPDTDSELDCMVQYQELYLDAMEAAAVKALEDLAPIQMYGAEVRTEGMNYVRHYLLENGTYAGPNFGDFSAAPVVGHAAENDPSMRIVKLARQDKAAILLVNFQVHPTATGGMQKTDLSSDFVGAVRDHVEASTGMYFAYFTGAAGNQVMTSQIPEEMDGLTKEQSYAFGKNHYLIYGWRLAQYVMKALPDLQEMACDCIAVTREYFEQPVNHDDEHLYDVAAEVRRLWDETDRDTANTFARQQGISSVYHAGAIMKRRSRPQTQVIELNAVRIGDLGLVTVPYEMFAANGTFVKAHSPFPMTLVCSLANEHWFYVPTREAFEYGCYESCISYFAKGTGETTAEKLVGMLKPLA